MYYVMFEMFCKKLVSSCEDTQTKVYVTPRFLLNLAVMSPIACAFL